MSRTLSAEIVAAQRATHPASAEHDAASPGVNSAATSFPDGFIAPQAWRSVEVSPDDAVRRRRATWRGISAEVVRITRPGKIVTRFHAPIRMLAARTSRHPAAYPGV